MAKQKDKIAIYARVSTELVEQDSSFQAQIKYFTDKFADKYEIVQVYKDKGSGLSLKNRPQFQQMIKDAGLDIEERKGKINTYLSNSKPKFKYILTKSVSRFSRNTEITTIIRDLKQKGVFVIFDDINKSTEDDESEMLLGFLQSISQEESRNKSQVIKWGKKRSAEKGTISLQVPIYGYQINLEENTLRIIPHEADVVEQIFNLALEGNGVRKIKRILTDKNVFNQDGKQFSEFHLLYMLRNPKYCGFNIRNRWEKIDLYNSTKKREKPESEWIVQETNKIDKIITRETFDKVQELIIKRSSAKRGVNIGKGELSQKIKCSICGSFYTRNQEVKKDGNIRVFYHCGNKKRNGVKACSSRNITQSEIEEHLDKYINTDYYEDIYKSAINQLIVELYSRKNDILKQKNYRNIDEIKEIKSKIEVEGKKLNTLLENMLEDSTATFKKIYAKKTKSIEEGLIPLEKRLKELEITEDDKLEIVKNIEYFIIELSNYKLEKYSSRNDFIEKLKFFSVHDKILMAHTKLDVYLNFVKSVIYEDMAKIKEDKKGMAMEIAKQLKL